MDFAYHYTEEQERFRHEVQTWFEKNIPEGMKTPVDSDPIGREAWTREQFLFWREKHQELAEKGWLYPTFPKEYGGGGLTPEHETILQEEFLRARAPGSFTNPFIFPALLVWASEEQRRKFLVPLLKAEVTAWQKFTEPHSGSDLASYESRAVRDGDDWIIRGQNVFIGGNWEPDWLFGPAMTDPDAPRHRNLGFFMIPYPSSGLKIRSQNLLNGLRSHEIFLDNVRVPGDHLIGGDHQGWQVANTSLEQEHGGRGQAFPRDEALDTLIEYVRGTKHNDGGLGDDPVIQQEAMSAYINSQISMLFNKRNYWMYQARREMSYHGSQSSLFRKSYHLENSEYARDIMGVYSVVGTQDPRAPFEGQPETYQRRSLIQVHPGGTLQIQKVIIARRIGISRTQERAAPTPATATSHAS